MEKEKYIAYVGTYTHGSSIGIHLYDVDVEEGTLSERKVVPVNNSSYVVKSKNGKYLYSIADEGVAVFEIKPDGDLELINKVGIDGMRGCYLCVDDTGKYLFVAGYHDGKITVLRLDPETGKVGEITEEIFHKGLGSIAERSFRPHISCVKMTRDNKYLCAADLGIDYVNVYKLDHEKGTLKQVDIIRCDLESAPRHLKFSDDGRYLYVVSELKNCIDVYHYHEEDGTPFFDHVQTIPTTDKYQAQDVAASALNISVDGKYILASNAGENSVSLYEIQPESGELNRLFCLPISGEYPKDASLFPDNKHLVCLNHESDTMTFFTVDLNKNVIIMNGKEMKVKQPNCIIFHEMK